MTVVTVATIYLSPSWCTNPEFTSETLINNVVSDPRTGRLYVGAVNHLYQLNSALELEFDIKMGPKKDNPQCTPPIADNCDNAKETDNHNKLLLVFEGRNELVVCGSLFRGICSLRNLSNVGEVIYYSDGSGEKSYVTSSEEGVSVVGVMSNYTKDGNKLPVFLVRSTISTGRVDISSSCLSICIFRSRT